MRQGQQNRRGRGRNNNNNNNNNRKSQNPLTRSFESTGPDVKVRGTPAHVAEKYISLARDALSSGDRVLAENYLQHAEHYNRIILTYREQQMSQGGEFQGGLPRAQMFNAQDPMEGDEFGDEDGENAVQGEQPQIAGGEGQPQGHIVPQRQFDNQQRYDNRPRHDNRNDHRHHNQPRHDRDGNRYDRGERHDNRGENRFNRNDRHDRQDRNFDRQDRGPDRGQDRNQDRGERYNRDMNGNGGEPRDQQFLSDGQPVDGQQHGQQHGMRRRDRFDRHGGGSGERQPPQGFAPQPAMPAQPAAPLAQPQASPALESEQQPAFLRRPVRRPRRDDGDVPASPPPPREAVGDDAE